MASLPVLSNQLANACDGCTACCDVLAIQELGKPFYSRCKHLVTGGCGNYESRPGPCVMFRCAWHAGILGESVERRPDRCGLMFDLNPIDNPPRINIWEVVPGALADDAKLQYLLKKMRDHKKIRGIRFGLPAVVLYPYGSKLGLRFDVGDDYRGWIPPASPRPVFRPYRPDRPEQAVYGCEIEPLRLPLPPGSQE